MLDTIILMVEQGNYDILDYRKFGMTEIEFFEKPMTFKKYVNNPTAKDKLKGIYKPRLTLIKRIDKKGLERLLKIEFSAPKLIFGNNLDELNEKDFDTVVEILQQRLLDMGVFTNKELIKEANVSAFHPSKNIKLTAGYTATLAIKELSKINLTRKLDLNKTSFRNEGHSLQYYANSHSFVIYDKIADLRKPKKRSVDKNQPRKQLLLFEHIKRSRRPLEILKMEVRLSKKKKMNSVLRRIGYPENPSFQDIFRKNLSKKILQLYWEMMVQDNLFLFVRDNNPQRLFGLLLDENPQMKTKQAIYLIGLNTLCRDRGIRKLRHMLDAKRSKTNWSRMRKDLCFFDEISSCQRQHGFITDIQEALERFESFRMNEHEFEL